MSDLGESHLYQVVRTEIRSEWPQRQVIEFEVTDSLRVAEAVLEIWSRRPAVKAGLEAVSLVRL